MNDTQLDRLLADASPYYDDEVRSLTLNRADADLLAEIVDVSNASAHEGLRLEAVVGRPTRSVLSRARVITTAAACLMLVIGLAVWQANGSDGPSSAPATTPVVTTTPPVPGPQLSWPPRILLDDSWTATYADEDPTDAYGEIQFVRAGDNVSVTWRPDQANLETYTDSASMTVETDAEVLGRPALVITYLGADPPEGVTAPTVPVTATYGAIIPVDDGTIEVALELQRDANLEGTLASLRAADTTTWEAALPARTVTPEERPEAVTQILTGIPIPAELDVRPLALQPVYSDQYQLVAYVTGATMCGGLDVWFTANDDGDTDGAQAAAAALATSRDWAALNDIADEGAWPDWIWANADAINGDTPDTEVGPGGVPTRLSAANSGCNRFWTGDSLPPDASTP